MKFLLSILALILISNSAQAIGIRCPKFIKTAFGITTDVAPLLAPEEAKTNGVFTRELNGISYTVKYTPFRDGARVDIKASNGKSVIIEDNLTNVDTAELTLLHGKLTLITSHNLGEGGAVIKAWDVSEKKALYENLQISEPITGIQAFAPAFGLHLAVAVSAKAQKVFVFDVDSAIVNDTPINPYRINGLSQMHPNEVSLVVPVFKQLRGGGEEMKKRLVNISITREGADLAFWMVKPDGKVELLGYAPIDLLNIRKH